MVRHRRDSQIAASDPGTHFVPLARLVSRVSDRALLAGNSIEPLVDATSVGPVPLRGFARPIVVFDVRRLRAEPRPPATQRATA